MAKAPNFDDRESFEAWLDSFDDETALAYAKVLSGRVALRVIPMLAELWGAQVEQEIKNYLPLHSLRANLLLAVARKYPTFANRQVADSAARSVGFATRSATRSAAVFAAVSVTYSSSVSVYSAIPAAINAAFSADSAARSAADSAAIWKSVREDAEALHDGMSVEALEGKPLWLNDAPEWFVKTRNDFRRALKTDGPHWDFWLDWYAAKVAGEPMDRLGIQGEDFIVQKLAEQGDAFWDCGPKAVSADIEAWIEEWEGEKKYNSVPSQKIASIRAIWQNDRVVADLAPTNSDLSNEMGIVALSSLQEDLKELAIDLERESNVDRRCVEYLNRVARLIPDEKPDLPLLMRLIRGQQALQDFENVADEQWSDILASRLNTLVSEFAKALDQFEDKRSYDRQIINVDLADLDFESVESDIQAVNNSFRSGEALEVVSDKIPEIIEQIASPLSDGMESNDITRIQADQLESANNVLKEVAMGDNDPIRNHRILQQINNGYDEGFLEGLIEGAREGGFEDGKMAGKNLGRASLAKRGARVGKQKLSEKYPRAFGWLDRFDSIEE